MRSFFVLSEREKETTKTKPARGQAKDTRSREINRKAKSIKGGQTHRQSEKQRQTRNKS